MKKFFLLPFGTAAIAFSVLAIERAGHLWSALLFVLTWQALMYWGMARMYSALVEVPPPSPQEPQLMRVPQCLERLMEPRSHSSLADRDLF